jgi:hypothetical protein
MSRKTLRSTALASVAVSISGAALLSISGVANADDPWYCNYGAACQTSPWDDPNSNWSWNGSCTDWEGSACGCLAQTHWIDPWDGHYYEGYAFTPGGHSGECGYWG